MALLRDDIFLLVEMDYIECKKNWEFYADYKNVSIPDKVFPKRFKLKT